MIVMNSSWRTLVFFAFASITSASVRAQNHPAKVVVHWDKVVRVSQTTPTLQVVVNPPLRRGTPVHDEAYKALHDLGADYVRYVPWLPYPQLGVAELAPPKDGNFLEATKGHSMILKIRTARSQHTQSLPLFIGIRDARRQEARAARQ